MRVIYDRLSGQLEDHFTPRRLDEVRRSALEEIRAGVPSAMLAGLERSSAIVGHCEAYLQRLASDAPFLSTFTAMRLIPRSVVDNVYRSGGRSPRAIALSVSEGLAYATNALIAWADNACDIETERARHEIELVSDVMENALRILIVASLCRSELMHLRTLSYAVGMASDDVATLIDSYNDRQRAVDAVVRHDSRPVLLLGNQPDPDTRVSVTFPNARTPLSIAMPNYLPLDLPADVYYGHLEFVRYVDDVMPGIDGASFWKSWITLNGLLLGALPRQPLADAHLLTNDSDRDRFDRLHDLCTGGWTGASKAALLKGHPHAATVLGSDAPDLAEFSATIDALTVTPPFDSGDSVDFVERPFTFYRIGPDVLIWDVMRHAGVVRSLVRRAVAGGGTVGNRAGAAFESDLENRLRTALPTATVLVDVNVGNGEGAMQIDAVCVIDDIALCIEAKGLMRNVATYRPNVQRLGSRVDQFRAFLDGRDRLLGAHAAQLRERFSRFGATRALSIVCSFETEMTPSLEANWWLEPGRVPRICTPTELITWLATNPTIDNPAVVSLEK